MSIKQPDAKPLTKAQILKLSIDGQRDTKKQLRELVRAMKIGSRPSKPDTLYKIA